MVSIIKTAMKVFFSILIAIVFSAGSAIGQENSNASSQQNGLVSVVGKLRAHSNHYLQEKVFIHTDQSFYLTGETIWFKVYCVDGSFHRPLAVSKVAYVEVMDGNHKPILQSKIELNEDGCGSGTLFLPVSISSGHYLVRAYTNWMKNFSPDLYFQQWITVVNPFTPQPLTSTADLLHYDVQFFPEGGNLVNGLQSVVGFRAVNQNGRGIGFRGFILNEKNDTLAKINPLKFGMGRFSFTPAKDHEYRAVITDANQKRFSYKLPASFEEGMVLHLSEMEDKIEVRVISKSKDHAFVHLLAHSRQKIMIYDTQSLQDGEAVFRLDKNSLGEGISHITVFNSDLIPVCERLYFKKPTEELAIDVRPESISYVPRKKVNVNVQTSLAGGMNTIANLSASIFKVDSLEESRLNIVNYLLLTSELKGNIESPAYYFEKDDSQERREGSDNLMLTHGWIRFKWEDIFSGKYHTGYAPEYNGHIVTGQIKEMSTKAPAKGVLTYLTSAGVYTRPYVSRSNDQGDLLFEMQNFYGRNELITQTNTQIDSLYRIEIFSPFSEKKSEYALPQFDLSPESKNLIEQRSIHVQVHTIFFKNERSLFRKPPFDSVAFYGPPDEKYNLDDYTRFPTMEEVMREFIRGVQVRKRKDGFHFMNYDLVNRTLFVNNPFVMLDGVPAFDINKIMSFDPHQVKSVEVMNRKYYLGVSAFEGIVSYRTYRGDLGGFQPDVRSLIMSYDGLQLQREFFSPHYETSLQRESTLPDTRNLLYWGPSVITDQEGKGQIHFYTSDITGKYRVVVQGITKGGIPGYSSTTFEVR